MISDYDMDNEEKRNEDGSGSTSTPSVDSAAKIIKPACYKIIILGESGVGKRQYGFCLAFICLKNL